MIGRHVQAVLVAILFGATVLGRPVVTARAESLTIPERYYSSGDVRLYARGNEALTEEEPEQKKIKPNQKGAAKRRNKQELTEEQREKIRMKNRRGDARRRRNVQVAKQELKAKGGPGNEHKVSRRNFEYLCQDNNRIKSRKKREAEKAAAATQLDPPPPATTMALHPPSAPSDKMAIGSSPVAAMALHPPSEPLDKIHPPSPHFGRYFPPL